MVPQSLAGMGLGLAYCHEENCAIAEYNCVFARFPTGVGNPDCWRGGYTFPLCCEGGRSESLCWTGGFDRSKCCLDVPREPWTPPI